MEAYKIGVTVPLGTEHDMMDALDGYFSPLYPGYDHAYSWWETEGSWRPLEGSHPHQGEIGRIERARGGPPHRGGPSLRGACDRRDPADPVEGRHCAGR